MAGAEFVAVAAEVADAMVGCDHIRRAASVAVESRAASASASASSEAVAVDDVADMGAVAAAAAAELRIGDIGRLYSCRVGDQNPPQVLLLPRTVVVFRPWAVPWRP